MSIQRKQWLSPTPALLIGSMAHWLRLTAARTVSTNEGESPESRVSCTSLDCYGTWVSIWGGCTEWLLSPNTMVIHRLPSVLSHCPSANDRGTRLPSAITKFIQLPVLDNDMCRPPMYVLYKKKLCQFLPHFRPALCAHATARRSPLLLPADSVLGPSRYSCQTGRGEWRAVT